MKLKSIAAAAALAASGVLFSTPVLAQSTDLGTLDAAGQSFSQGFWRLFNYGSPLGAFTDVYTFHLVNASTAAGGTITFDWGALDLSLTSASLSGTGLASPLVDNTPASFSFSGLGAGDYSLSISGMLTPQPGWVGVAGYQGTIYAVASPAPEPATLALLAAGMAFLGFTALRARRA